MEIWDVIALATLYGRLILLGSIVVIGLGLSLTRTLRWLGIVLAVPAASAIAYIVLKPLLIEVTPQPPPIITTFDGPPRVVPSTLVIHGYFGARPNVRDLTREAGDAFTLAETGLFRVFLAGPAQDDSIVAEAAVGEAADCADARSSVLDVSQDFTKIGGLLFTARTGFTRCAKIVMGTLPDAGDRLDLWTSRPPGAPEPSESLPGIMLLKATEDGHQRTIARREAHARQIANTDSRLGAYSYDPRPEYSEIGSYHPYDPDPVGFTLEALRMNPDTLPLQGAVPDAELTARADAIVASVRDVVGKQRTAISLVGALRGPLDETKRLEGRLASAFVHGPPNPRLTVRGPSDCPVALRVTAARQSLASTCTAASGSTTISCRVPFERESFLERCVSGVRDTIWDRVPRGRPTLILGGRGEPSGLGVGRMDPKRSAVLRHVVIRPEGGAVDLVLVSSSAAIWSLEGSVGCLDRVTVVGNGQGVAGLEPELIQFRNRLGADHYQSDKPGKPLQDLLGRPAVQMGSTDATTGAIIIGDQQPLSAACRDLSEKPAIGSTPSPDGIVSQPDEVVFKMP